MPEFFAEHVPDNLDAFTTGYLEAVEWLLQGSDDAELDRDKLRGFTRAAIRSAKVDCRDFQEAHGALLEEYLEHSGRDMSGAGVDFYLSRCGHGAGFFDRGNEPCFDALQEEARHYGNVDHYVWRGWIYESGAEPKRRKRQRATQEAATV